MLLQILSDILTALSQTVTLVGVERTGLGDGTQLSSDINQRTGTGNSLPEHDVEFCLFERWSNLVLDNLYTGADTNHVSANFESFNTADIQADG